jgi:hypothetical protein
MASEPRVGGSNPLAALKGLGMGDLDGSAWAYKFQLEPDAAIVPEPNHSWNAASDCGVFKLNSMVP